MKRAYGRREKPELDVTAGERRGRKLQERNEERTGERRQPNLKIPGAQSNVGGREKEREIRCMSERRRRDNREQR